MAAITPSLTRFLNGITEPHISNGVSLGAKLSLNINSAAMFSEGNLSAKLVLNSITQDGKSKVVNILQLPENTIEYWF